MQKNDKINFRTKGIVVSLLFHGILLAVLLSFSLPVIFPQPEEQGIIIDFDEEIPPVQVTRTAGSEKPAVVNDPGESVEVAPLHARPSNKTRAQRADNRADAKPSTAGDDGDIERYEPEQNKVNPRALFNSSGSGEAEHDDKTRLRDNSLFPGTGTSNEPTRGPNATQGSFTQEKGVGFSLAGRSVSGNLPLPAYTVQKAGRVVVEVSVNQNGYVVSATALLKGSTITDVKLLRAAEEAAKKSRFNVDDKASPLQVGTITYNFRLQ